MNPETMDELIARQEREERSRHHAQAEAQSSRELDSLRARVDEETREKRRRLVGPYQPDIRAGMDPGAIARVCHEANRAVQVEQADPTIAVSPPWDETDPETRASAIDGVLAVLAGATPEASHENWVRFKVDHGWVYGPAKDLERKEHPLLIPYAALPPAQRAKDALFHAIVRALG